MYAFSIRIVALTDRRRKNIPSATFLADLWAVHAGDCGRFIECIFYLHKTTCKNWTHSQLSHFQTSIYILSNFLITFFFHSVNFYWKIAATSCHLLHRFGLGDNFRILLFCYFFFFALTYFYWCKIFAEQNQKLTNLIVLGLVGNSKYQKIQQHASIRRICIPHNGDVPFEWTHSANVMCHNSICWRYADTRHRMTLIVAFDGIFFVVVHFDILQDAHFVNIMN